MLAVFFLNVYSSNHLGTGSEVKFQISPPGVWVLRNFCLRQLWISISGHVSRKKHRLSLKDAKKHKEFNKKKYLKNSNFWGPKQGVKKKQFFNFV